MKRNSKLNPMDLMINAFMNGNPMEEKQAGTYLLLSLDLINSTAFKNEYPDIWTNVFLCFYGEALLRINSIGFATRRVATCVTRSAFDAGLWKTMGDEILIYVKVPKAELLFPILATAQRMLDTVLPHVAEDVVKLYTKMGFDEVYCAQVAETITTKLGVKGTAWLADCKDMYSMNADNIVIRTPGHVDFLGKEIDQGFRLAKFAEQNKFVVSPYLAWVIWKNADEELREKAAAWFWIQSFEPLKGVWNGEKVPVIFFDSSCQGNQGEDNFFDQLDNALQQVSKTVEVQEILAKLDGYKLPVNFDLSPLREYVLDSDAATKLLN